MQLKIKLKGEKTYKVFTILHNTVDIKLYT